uniref:Protein translocase subunit SecA n=1 Tax=Astrosyne radiata TaxID=1158023 RepID=A0A2U9NTC7_9STRA|nr:preprotein-translocase subunit a [Astrosyne radiata]AWT40384.1 preprotein-translocase subunit a [Astrosyne radiata]
MLKLFSNPNLKKYQEIISEINTLEENLKTLNDNELRRENEMIKHEFKKEQNLSNLLPRSFALTREASKRTLGLRHFDVQIIGGLVLNEKKIAEMKTGEGKTLVATLPAVLNAISGKGVHIVTVNDYLAKRDQLSMGQIYRFLSFNTGLINENSTTLERKKNYNADITYVTNHELSFDFLRDNIATEIEQIVLRPFNYCIIDEIDSILIDEAQTPVILTENNQDLSIQKYIIAEEAIKYLTLNKHYEIDEKNQNIILNETGYKVVEQAIKRDNLYDVRDPWIAYIMNALKANHLYYKDIHYIIQNNRIISVDEFTGRLMIDRRWGDGLHQALEAKENIPIRPSSQTVASISYQNFFLMYPKLTGMTGTGKTAEVEFEKIYDLKVEIIPPYRTNKRIDLPDLIYKNQFTKWTAITQFCRKIFLTNQPILVGTKTVEKSEMLGQLLKEFKLPYQLLNAKPENVRREAEIIAQAGKLKTITISTNMAGRGTDIILGGNSFSKVQKELYNFLTISRKSKKISKNLIIQYKDISQQLYNCLIILLTDLEFLKLPSIYLLQTVQQNSQRSISSLYYERYIQLMFNKWNKYYYKHYKQENSIIKNIGGLYVIGTERNDSLRVDNQLRGRCGRQGDPGKSLFFLSLDDTLLRLFGGTKFQTFVKTQLEEDEIPLQSTFLAKTLNKAQKQIEERAYTTRKTLFDYDQILNQQRTIAYFERNEMVNQSSHKSLAFTYGEQVLKTYLNKMQENSYFIEYTINILEEIFGKELELKIFHLMSLTTEEFDLTEIKCYFVHEFWLICQKKFNEILLYGNDIFKNIEREQTFRGIDQIWKEHLDKIILLRNAVIWQSYGQKNPLTEYKRQAYETFSNRKEIFLYYTLYILFKTNLE